HELASQLRTGCESAKQKIARARSGTGTTDTAVCLCFEYLLSYFDRTRDWRIALIAASCERNARAVWIAAILFLQRLLDSAEIHRLFSPRMWSGQSRF